MKLSVPESDPNEPVPDGPVVVPKVAVPWSEEPVPVAEAIERLAESYTAAEERTDAESLRRRLREIEASVAELTGLVRRVRADLAGVYAMLDTYEGMHGAESAEQVWVPESIDPFDPLGEFEE